jgi:hypothetical protein
VGVKRIDLAAGAIAYASSQIMAMLGDDEDTRAYLDTLEAETDLHEVAGALIASIEEDEGQSAALTMQMAVRKERRDRCEARIEAKRRGLVALLDAAKLEKLVLPEATISVRDVAPKLAVSDTEAIPEEYTTVVRKPDMAKLKAAFADKDQLPNWLRREDARRSATVRRR